MKRSLFGGFLVFLGSLALAGCMNVTRPATVNVSAVNLLPTRTGLLETEAALTLRFTNESGEPLSMIGGVHKLYLNNTYVGRAVSNEGFTLPPLSTVTQTVTVFLENLPLMRKGAELMNTNHPILAYRLESALRAAEGGNDRTLAATSSGELDLTSLMAAGPLAERR